MRDPIARFAALLVAGGLLAPAQVQAQSGITDSMVRLGVLMPFSNTAAEVGTAYMGGAKAAAEEINRQGGVAGRKIRLLPIDTLPVATDTLEQATDALRTTQADEQVFALLGTMGQEPVMAVGALLESNGIPLIGALTGLVGQTRDGSPWVFPVRRRDQEVMAGLVRLLNTMSVVRLAVVHPRSIDAISQLQYLRDASKGTNVQIVGQFDVGDTNIELEPQVKAVQQARPDAVLSLGGYAMTEALVRQTRAAGYKGLYVTHSDVGTLRLMASLKELSRGLGVASGVPSPYAVALPVAREFRAAMEKLPEGDRKEFDEASFEGYLAVRVFAEGMKRAGASATRKGLRNALTGQPLEINGLTFDFRRAQDKGLQTPANLYVMTRDGRVSQ